MKKKVIANSEAIQELVKKMLDYPTFKRIVKSHELDGDEYIFKLKSTQPMLFIGSHGFPSLLKIIASSGFTLVAEAGAKRDLILYLREA